MKPSTDREVSEMFAAVMLRHRSTAPGDALRRMRAFTRAVLPTPTLPVRLPCANCGQRIPRYGVTCYDCTRITDDTALVAAGYRIDDYHHVIDTLEGHRMLRSVALSRLAGRAA